MINKKLSADEFAQKLLNDRAFRKDAYQAFYDRCYQLPELDGVLSSDVLHQLIRKAKSSRSLQSMLAELLYLVDADSVTDKNFRQLLHFPGKKRNTYLSALGHSDLSFYQMLELNRHSLSLEAFSYLLDVICTDAAFTTGDLIHVLQENKDVRVVGFHDTHLLHFYSAIPKDLRRSQNLHSVDEIIRYRGGLCDHPYCCRKRKRYDL